MKILSPAIFIFCYIFHLIPGGMTGPPLQRSGMPYGTRILRGSQGTQNQPPLPYEHSSEMVTTKLIERPGYDVSENMPYEVDQPQVSSHLQTTSTNSFYDPSYGFSQESIAMVIGQDNNKESKAEPVLSAVLLNSKDYYKLFNYNNPKIHDKERATYFGKSGYQLLQSEDLKFSENKNSYSSVVNQDTPYNKHETSDMNQLLTKVNDNKSEKQEFSEEEQFYKNLLDERYKYANNKPKPFLQQRPYQVDERIRHQFLLEDRRPQFVADDRYRPQQIIDESVIQQKRPLQFTPDVIAERNRSLDELMEESKALTEQIKRLRIRTERELSNGAQLQRKGRGSSHRWYRQ